jgi:hypothetical protein
MKKFEIERWQASFDSNTARLLCIGENHPGKLGSIRPFPGAWSVAECVEHLAITADAFLPIWTEAMSAQDHHFGSEYPFWWRWFLAGIENPARMRSSTPSSFVPPSNISLENVLERYMELRSQVRSVANEMYASDIGGIKIQSPFASWMKYPLDFSFDLWLAHESRHLFQAEKG